MADTTRKYRTSTTVLAMSGDVSSDCNSITFINEHATADASVGDVAIVAGGGAFGVDGLAGELDTTVYRVNFPSGAGRVVVVKKIYV